MQISRSCCACFVAFAIASAVLSKDELSWNATSPWSLATDAATSNPAARPGATDNAIFNITAVNTAQTVNLDAAEPV